MLRLQTYERHIKYYRVCSASLLVSNALAQVTARFSTLRTDLWRCQLQKLHFLLVREGLFFFLSALKANILVEKECSFSSGLVSRAMFHCKLYVWSLELAKAKLYQHHCLVPHWILCHLLLSLVVLLCCDP